MAGKTTAVVMDKTGTLTEGRPRVTKIVTAENDSALEDQTLVLAAAAESVAQHPLASAILEKMTEKGKVSPVLPTVGSFENIPGKGIKATLENQQEVLVGSSRLMEEAGLAIGERLLQAGQELSAQGNTLVYVATLEPAGGNFPQTGKLLGLIAIADTIRDTSREAVEQFKSWGVKTVLLTGDNRRAGDFIGQQVGVDQVIAEVLPQEKAQVIERLQKEGHQVMMVGDGINDAPALVQADTGVAIGGGSDIAVEAGSVILMKSDVRDAARTIRLSRLTLRNIRQNLFWAFLYNTIGIPIAAGVLYPFTGLLMTPMLAGLAMSLSSVCVVSNALRLKTKKL